MNPIFLIWIISLIVKLILSALIPISPDEAYYWVWSHHLSLSYFDHPPFVAWLFYLGHIFEGLGQAVRWPGVILSHCTILIWYRLSKNLIEPSLHKIWILLFLLNPLIGWGGIVITPDVPLLFFWSLSLYFCFEYFQKQSAKTSNFLGVSLGLGVCSKYMIVVFFPLLFFWLVVSKNYKKLKYTHVFLAIIMGTIFSLPVILWNYQNAWASFQFQIGHGLGESKINWYWPLEFVLGQLGVLFPLIFIMAFQSTRKNKEHWLSIFGWGALLFFFVTSFKGKVEANWPIMGYPALMTLSVLKKENYKWLKYTLTFWMVALILVCSEVFHPWVPYGDKIKLNELRQYDILLPYVNQFQPLYTNSYQMASILTYQLKTPIYKLKGLDRRDFYDDLNESKPTAKEYFVAVTDGVDWAPISGQIKMVKEIEKFKIFKIVNP